MPILHVYHLVGQVTVCQLRFRCDGFHDAFDVPECLPYDERGTLFQHSLGVMRGWREGRDNTCFCPRCAGTQCQPLENFKQFQHVKLRQIMDAKNAALPLKAQKKTKRTPQQERYERAMGRA